MENKVQTLRMPEIKNKKSKKKKRRKVILIILAISLLAIVLFLIDVYRRADVAFNEMYDPLGDTVVDRRAAEGLPALNLGEDPFSILILGLDDGRTDAMMVATINPNEGSAYLVSIARDTMVDIPGH